MAPSVAEEKAEMGLLWALNVRAEMCWQSCLGKFYTVSAYTVCLAVIVAFILSSFPDCWMSPNMIPARLLWSVIDLSSLFVLNPHLCFYFLYHMWNNLSYQAAACSSEQCSLFQRSRFQIRSLSKHPKVCCCIVKLSPGIFCQPLQICTVGSVGWFFLKTLPGFLELFPASLTARGAACCFIQEL